MRLRTLIKVLALGLAARAIIRSQRDRRVPSGRGEPARDPFAADLDDPVQRLDGASVLPAEPLEVDARSREDIEAAQDLVGMEIEIDRIAGEDDVQVELIDLDALAAARGGLDLHGRHAPAAVDRTLRDDDSFADGQNWLEALETSAIENGAGPERELSEMVDDDDVFRTPHTPVTRDTPVADHGSGGRRGL